MNISSFRYLFVGLVLVLSACQSSAQKFSWEDGTVAPYMRVQDGDSLADLAKRVDVSSKDLIWFNGLVAPYVLRVNQKIYIPTQKEIAQHYEGEQDAVFTSTTRRTMSGDSDVAPRVELTRENIAHASLARPRVAREALDSVQKHSFNEGIQRTVQRSATRTAQRAAAVSEPYAAPSHKAKERASSASVMRREEDNRVALASSVSHERAPEKAEHYSTSSLKSSDCFLWPLKNFELKSPKIHRLYEGGLSFETGVNYRVYASAPGRVLYIGSGVPGLGRLIIISHADDIKTIYAFLKSIRVHTGEEVKQGQVIALVAKRDGPTRLHFEVRRGVKVLNAYMWMKKHACS